MSNVGQTFRCSECSEIFIQTYTTKEVLAELNRIMPHLDPEECVMVCEVCYEKLGYGPLPIPIWKEET